ncbi:PEP-CTERM sorting domain-containing protein [Aquabacterium sp. OR-4]|uniref:PEP-CTERM sorting domain-containing protein n=1 Tax=Aquabacterium sp. OR-4 TaxID=2978127 RepID=UPI0021B48DBD|nr:PEP-CTERM sorting domain-containing protein [Aquabacterium sp. OR-4]MDT7834645.1 hypothetical protein [Aquabacterium sp. OR-4]
MKQARNALTALAMAAGIGLGLSLGTGTAQAGQQLIEFDAPAEGLAAVAATYGLSVSGGVADARVVGGQLLLYGTGGLNGHLVFDGAPGDLRFEFDTWITGAPGNTNVGFTTGNQVFFIHPGYWDKYQVPNLGLSGSLGFTPDENMLTHFSVDISATGHVSVVIQNNHLAAIVEFNDTAYVPGVSRPGLTVGSVPGHWVIYDNLVITTVPEPGTAALWLGALALLAAVQRARRRSGATPPG